MKKHLMTFAAFAAALSAMACTHEQTVLDKAPGNYQSTKTSTDANGTTTTKQSYTDVSVDENGRKRAVVKSKTTKDPRGLFNKTTTNDTTEVIEQ